MAFEVVEPIRIGGKVRQPGYRLTERDMKGRHIGWMRRHGEIKHVDDKRRSRRSAGDSDDE